MPTPPASRPRWRAIAAPAGVIVAAAVLIAFEAARQNQEYGPRLFPLGVSPAGVGSEVSVDSLGKGDRVAAEYLSLGWLEPFARGYVVDGGTPARFAVYDLHPTYGPGHRLRFSRPTLIARRELTRAELQGLAEYVGYLRQVKKSDDSHQDTLRLRAYRDGRLSAAADFVDIDPRAAGPLRAQDSEFFSDVDRPPGISEDAWRGMTSFRDLEIEAVWDAR